MLKELLTAFGSIPGVLIPNDEVICAVQKETGLKESAIRVRGRGNLFRSGQGAAYEHQNGCIFRRGMDTMPSLGRPGGVEIPSNFL